MHHSLADGIAIVLAFFHMTDEPRFEDYPAILIRFTWLKDLLMKCVMPFYLLWLVFDILFIRKAERNGFKTNENTKKLTAVKNVRFIPDIPTETVKRRAKELSTKETRVTFNDILMTAISKSLNDYLRERTSDMTTK